MTDSGKNESSSAQDNASADTAALPFYRRPWFWGGLLLLAIIMLALWLAWREWQNAEARRLALEAELAQTRQTNEAREAFLAQLRALLQKDPCVIQEELMRLTPPPGIIWPPLSTNGPVVPDAQQEAGPQNSPRSGEALKIPAAPPGSVGAILENATVLVLAKQSAGLSMGSGFFVAPGYVVSNAHVVGDAREILVVNKALKKPLPATVVSQNGSNGRDFAVLRVSNAPPITPLKLNTSVMRTQKVSAWGFPSAVTLDDPKFRALMQGNAASAPEVVFSEGPVNVVLERNPPLIVHSATVSQGNSGGPLVNENGEVVGINTFIKLDDESYRQSSLAIVSSALGDFLRSAQVPFSLAASASPDAAKTAGGKP